MQFATSKSSLLDQLAKHGVVVDVKLEVGEVGEMESELMLLLNPAVVDKPKFTRPARPGKQ